MSEEPAKKRVKLSSGSGHAIFGNYMSYYSKRKQAEGLDRRLTLLDKSWVANKRVLDVGCNSGKVTVDIAQHFQPYRCTGVDIDHQLVSLAKKQVSLAFSRQEPLVNVTKEEAEPQASPARNYFPLACPRMFGYLTQPPSDYLVRYEEVGEEEAQALTARSGRKGGRGKVMPREIWLFPHNIQFEAGDWVTKDIYDDTKGYDLILALSVSKWIHLNQGDEGLIAFFTKVFECLRPDGRFILEPQPWDSYKKPANRFPALKKSHAMLTYRPDDFSRILLEEIGFQRMDLLEPAGDSGFERPLQVYTKAGGSWFRD